MECVAFAVMPKQLEYKTIKLKIGTFLTAPAVK